MRLFFGGGFALFVSRFSDDRSTRLSTNFYGIHALPPPPPTTPSGYGQWPFIFDLLTMLMVETVWRTAAYLLIYFELALKLLYVGAHALLREAFAMRWVRTYQ